MRKNRLVFAASALGLVAAACAHEAAPQASDARDVQPIPIDVSQPVPSAMREPPAQLTRSSPAAEPAWTEPLTPRPEDHLPPAWTTPITPTLSFAEAMQLGRALRDQIGKMSSPRTIADVGVTPAAMAWFSKTQELAERSDRFFAAAFAARDATPDERIEAMSEALSLAVGVMQRLEDAHLSVIPDSWRSEPLLHASFEDIATGPGRRYKEEARALALHCVSTADSTKVTTSSATACRAFAGIGPLPVAALKKPLDAGASSACACSPGDPLCTTSAWCGP